MKTLAIIIIGFVLVAVATLLAIAIVRGGAMRKLKACRRQYEEGEPGGHRNRVWTDKERAAHRRDRERRKLRVIQ